MGIKEGLALMCGLVSGFPNCPQDQGSVAEV